MLDRMLMANEIVEDLRRCARSDLCLKVDFEKSYDSVRWDFLYEILNRMGFHCKWIKWIQGCLDKVIL